MQALELDIQNIQEYKVIRIDNILNKRSCYISIHSQNFVFDGYDRGNKLQKQSYEITHELNKYFYKRKFLFSKFQQGIQLDTQSWYSVIPQSVSMYLRQRFQQDGYNQIFQPFSGVGGIAIHLCDAFQSYAVNDIDQTKIEMLKNNMTVYDKQPNSLQIYCNDFLKIRPFETQMLIICPPWGGINTKAYSYQQIDQLMFPTLTDILTHALKFSKNIMLQMPKNTCIYNLSKIIQECGCYPIFSIQKIKTNLKTSQLFIYIGDQKFTHIKNSIICNKIYEDLQLYQKKHKIAAKKCLKQQPNKLMSNIFKVKSAKNKHIFFQP